MLVKHRGEIIITRDSRLVYVSYRLYVGECKNKQRILKWHGYIIT